MIAEVTAENLEFKNSYDLRRPVAQKISVLAFLAHPDDAEILCAGILIRLHDLGWKVHIATATPGDCGSVTLLAQEIPEIRRQEAATAASRLGATYDCLVERDAQAIFNHDTNRKAIDLFRRITDLLLELLGGSRSLWHAQLAR